MEQSFHEELNGMCITLPGNKNVEFSEDERLLDLARKLYPDWKKNGRRTSVPVARIPRLLVPHDQLKNLLRNQLKKLRDGEDAERKLYEQFMETRSDEEPGIAIFPNFDASHIFNTQEAKVEIDLIVVHPGKGVFLFNVKNVSDQATKIKKLRNKIKEDADRHLNFIRMLQKYSEQSIVPVHIIACNFGNNSSLFDNTDEKITELNKQSDHENFADLWWKYIEKLEDLNRIEHKSLDFLVARLIALSSIQCASVLIHEKMEKGVFQSLTNKENLKLQLYANKEHLKLQFIPNTSKKFAESFTTVSNIKDTKRFILWTVEQTEIIKFVFNQLEATPGDEAGPMNSSFDRNPQVKLTAKAAPQLNTGLRLLITGGKGTGKTMLLVFFAKMHQAIQPAEEQMRKRVLVCHGNPSCKLLTDALRYALEGIASSTNNIVVEDLKVQDVKNQLSGFDLILCDEAQQPVKRLLLDNLEDTQHCVMFSSEHITFVYPKLQLMHLKTCLRSTKQLAVFSNSYLQRPLKNVFLTTPNGSFTGKPPAVIIVDSLKRICDECVEAIKQFESNNIIIVPFVGTQFGNLFGQIKQKLLKEFDTYEFCVDPLLQPKSRDNQSQVKLSYNHEEIQKVVEKRSLQFTFVHPFTIEGCEFAEVLVLLDTEDYLFNLKDENRLLTAITRAYLKVVVIVKDFEVDHIGTLDKKLKQIRRDDVKKIQREFITTLQTSMSGDAQRSDMILFVGHIPADSKLIRQHNDIDGLSFFENSEGPFLHIHDMFLESDFNKIRTLGVKKIVISADNLNCNCEFFSYLGSYLCGNAYAQKNNDCFKVVMSNYNTNRAQYRLDFHRAFYLHFAKKERAVSKECSFPKFWLDLEQQPKESLDLKVLKTKASELVKHGQISAAIVTYECCIKLLQNMKTVRNESDEDYRNEMLQLSKSACEIYMSHALELVEDLQFQTLHYEDCMLRAFRHSANALKISRYQLPYFKLVENAISHLKNYRESDSLKKHCYELKTAESMGMKFEMFHHRLSPDQRKLEAEEEFKQMDSLISEYQKCCSKENCQSLRKQVSELAIKISKVSPKQRIPENHQHEKADEIFDEMMQVFEYSVQMVLLALHWNPSDKNQDDQNLLEQQLSKIESYLQKLKQQ